MRISVIIPCYNAEKTLKRAVHSALKNQADEVILVDNNSTDRTSEVMNQLKEASDKVILSNEVKKGAPAARNKGLSLAKNDYALFLDSDDELVEGAFSTYQAFLKSTGSFPDIIVGNYQEKKGGKQKEIRSKADQHPIMALFYKGLGKTSALLFKKSALDAVGAWNEAQALSQEYELLFRLIQHNSSLFHLQHVVAMIHEEDGESLTRSNQGRAWEIFLLLRKKIWDYIAHNHPELYRTEEKNMKAFIFHILRRLYNENEDAALWLYEEFYRNNKIRVGEIKDLNILYRVSFGCFDFAKTQAIWKLLKSSVFRYGE